MNNKDLDALAGLYESVYLQESGEYLVEAPQKTPSSTDIGYRVGRGLMGALRDLPAATISQLQGQGANRGNDAALKRQQVRGQRLMDLLRTGQVNKPTSKPATPAKPKVSNIPPAEGTGRGGPSDISGTSGDRTSGGGTSDGGKVTPSAPKPFVKQTGDKAKDEATWKKANPTLANKPKTPNPLMKDMPGQNKAELDQLRGNAAIQSISQSPSAKRILSGTAKSATANQIGKASLDRSAAATEAKPPAPKIPSTTNQTATAFSSPAIVKPTKTPAPTLSSKPTTNQTATAFSRPAIVKPTPSTTPIRKPGAVMSSFEWGSKATLKDVESLYSSIYEGKKKDQDQDGDNDFADVRIARMIASGMSKAEAIAAVKNKEYNEEFVTEDPIQDFRDMRASQNKSGARGPELSHSGPSKGTPKPGSAIATKQPRSREFSREVSSSTSRNTTGPSSPGYDTRRLGGSDLRRLTNSFEFESWVDSLVEEGYDLSDYTWEEMFDIYLDEAAKRTPKKTRGAKDPVAYMKGRSDAGKRISGDEDTGPRYYTLGRARGAEADAPTQPGQKPVRTPKLAGWEKDDIKYRKANLKAGKTHKVGGEKGLPEEYEIYEIVASYLLENNFAATVNDANVIIENMSEVWLDQILSEAPGEWFGGLRDRARASRAAQIQSAKPTPKPGPTVSSPFAKPASRDDSGRLTTYGAGGGAAAEAKGQTRAQVMQQGAKNRENKNRNPGPDFGR